MKYFKLLILLILVSTLNNCASGYRMIEPKTINYASETESDGVKLEYKYDLLFKKYEKKEIKKDLKLVAIKISNNSGRDLIFGKNIKLTYTNGSYVYIMDNEVAYKELKQSPASHLFYLLLTPVNLYTTTTESNSNGVTEDTNSFPIGLILGPGLAGGNIIAASSANKKFKEEMLTYDILGSTIKNGEIKYGLISIESNTYDALNLKID